MKTADYGSPLWLLEDEEEDHQRRYYGCDGCGHAFNLSPGEADDGCPECGHERLTPMMRVKYQGKKRTY
jgi:rRNA maturation endonuclease Nob1